MAVACLCHAVSERRVRREIDHGADSIEAIAASCGAGSCCYGCHPTIERLLDEHQEQLVATGEPRRRRFLVA
jgi:bacterioferritin-associated ferredoxin